MILHQLWVSAFAQSQNPFSISYVHRGAGFVTVFLRFPILDCEASCDARVPFGFVLHFRPSCPAFYRNYQAARKATRSCPAHPRAAGETNPGPGLPHAAFRALWPSTPQATRRSVALHATKRQVLPPNRRSSAVRHSLWPGPAHSHLGGHLGAAPTKPDRPLQHRSRDAGFLPPLQRLRSSTKGCCEASCARRP